LGLQINHLATLVSITANESQVDGRFDKILHAAAVPHGAATSVNSVSFVEAGRLNANKCPDFILLEEAVNFWVGEKNPLLSAF
jgi:hypothetical protein